MWWTIITHQVIGLIDRREWRILRKALPFKQGKKRKVQTPLIRFRTSVMCLLFKSSSSPYQPKQYKCLLYLLMFPPAHSRDGIYAMQCDASLFVFTLRNSFSLVFTVCFRCRIEGDGGDGRGGVDGDGLLFSSAYLNSSSTLCRCWRRCQVVSIALKIDSQNGSSSSSDISFCGGRLMMRVLCLLACFKGSDIFKWRRTRRVESR